MPKSRPDSLQTSMLDHFGDDFGTDLLTEGFSDDMLLVSLEERLSGTRPKTTPLIRGTHGGGTADLPR